MSQNNPTIYTGLDVAKNSFVIHFLGQCHSFANDPSGRAALVRLLQKDARPSLRLVLEATGGYEQPIVQALHEAQIPVSVVMPGRVRAYAKALGRHAKTDPIDAAVLTAFAQAVHPEPTLPRPAHEQRLVEAVRQRRQLVQLQTQLKNQAAHDVFSTASKRRARLLRTLAAEIAGCEKEIVALQAQDPVLQQRSKRLQEAPGVGPATAATLLAELPELGSVSAEKIAALAGLAPYNCDSGPFAGTRRITGGRASVRCALYMASLTASRTDGILKSFYAGLVANGKKKLVALTAVMRKLLVLLNRLLKDPNFKLQHA